MIKKLFLKYKSYIISILISLGTGILSALLTMRNMDIAAVANMPPLSPPAFLFPIVWTILFILMGVSAARIFDRRNKNPEVARSGLTYYAMSLVVNLTWSIIFFNLHSYLIASVWIVLLLALIVLTVIRYAAIDKISAYLQIPYILWVSFATYLTFGIFYLNG